MGVVYGLIPHIGCIAFVVFSVLGATALAGIFKPLLAKAYFFYILIGMSFIFATVSAIFFLRRNKAFSFAEIKKRWKYLFILYGTTIFVNILLFLVIFPIAFGSASKQVASVIDIKNQEILNLKVNIPCAGHTPLIIYELSKIDGVTGIKSNNFNFFEIEYDRIKTSREQILDLNVFKEYKASVI